MPLDTRHLCCVPFPQAHSAPSFLCTHGPLSGQVLRLQVGVSEAGVARVAELAVTHVLSGHPVFWASGPVCIQLLQGFGGALAL